MIGQRVDVSRFSTFIDSGQASSVVSAYVGCSQVHESDEAAVFLGYLDANFLSLVNGPGNSLKCTILPKNMLFCIIVIRTKNKPFEFQSKSGPIPVGTRTIKVYMGAAIYKLITPVTHQYCVVDDIKLFIFNNNTNG
jgi:hypothetical protein